MLDKDTHRPKMCNLESGLESRDVSCGQPRRISFAGADKEVSGHAGYSECDYNGHLNNCRYVDWFFNLLPDRLTSNSKPMRLDINFKTEILRGSEVIASIKELGSSRTDFCLRQRGSVACLASLSIL